MNLAGFEARLRLSMTLYDQLAINTGTNMTGIDILTPNSRIGHEIRSRQMLPQILVGDAKIQPRPVTDKGL
jgi:hypothetical protein